jgi:hypothetical protein
MGERRSRLARAPSCGHDRHTQSLRMSDGLRAVRDVRPTRLAGWAAARSPPGSSHRRSGWRYTSGCAVWHIQHEKVTRMETAQPCPPLVIAVVDDNPADGYIIARVLQAHRLPYLLQVLESRQRVLHFLTSWLGRTSGVLISCCLTLPCLD